MQSQRSAIDVVVRCRVTAASFAAVLSPLAGIAVSLAGALPARGVDGPFTERVISTVADGAQSVFATDVDGDGDIDVLSASGNDDKIAWYESDGGSPPTFTERVISNTAFGAQSVFATDVDGDGDTDVLSASSKIAWYESDGGSPPTFTERVILTDAGRGRCVVAIDMDGDGDIDVLSASELDDNIAWYESDGGSPPSFTKRVISASADLAFSVFATDLDGDGDIDVLSASGSAGNSKIAWYESDGGSPPTFSERVLSITTSQPRSVFATDLDGDGDTDVLSASAGDDKIAWYESDGGSPPTFTERVISTTANGAFSVFAMDVDGDGDTDVLSASIFDDKIAWYENTTPRCGNGSVDPGEECDGGLGCTNCLCDAGFEPTAPTSLDCQPTCGNGSIDPDEECDDGNTVDGDGCSSNCLREEACCLTDDSCQLIDVASCAAQGGVAQGPGSICGGTEACCDSATGACYTADRTCCLANGDSPQGPGTACTAPQECCFSNNTCTNLDPLCCVDQGGTPQGSGSTCGTCGDGTCDCDEDFDSCCQDCPCPECTHCFEDCFGGGRVCEFLCATDCGDGTCDPACENCDTCPVDCACDDCTTCNAATGTCDPDCGNGVCQPLCGENCRTCPGDCACAACDTCSVGGSCVSACGDGTCDPSCETCSSCPQDCHACGDGCCTASAGESCCSCAQDCGPCCGNGVCDDLCGEDCSTCPDDCQLPEGEECMPTVTEWGLMALVLLLLIGLAIKFGQYRRVPTGA